MRKSSDNRRMAGWNHPTANCRKRPELSSPLRELPLSRWLSPALVDEYQTRLPDKKLLQAKLHEFYALSEPEME